MWSLVLWHYASCLRVGHLFEFHLQAMQPILSTQLPKSVHLVYAFAYFQLPDLLAFANVATKITVSLGLHPCDALCEATNDAVPLP